MKFIITLICLIFVLWLTPVSAYDVTPDKIYQHIDILAHDSLEGREVGEPGEYKAALYIKKQFELIGLAPRGTDNYFQPFEFVKTIDFGPNNHLTLNGTELVLGDDYEPMRQSGSLSFSFDEIVDVDYGIKIPENEGSYNDYENKEVAGKAVLIKRFSPSSDDNPHVDFSKYESLTDKISTALDEKAKAILFITPSSDDDTLPKFAVGNIYPKDIPILFLRRKALEKLNLDLDNPQISSLSGQTELVKTRDTSQNVIGYLPTSNDTTVIIGAHYDHLGWGGFNSLYTGKEKMIHNGADDNASGVAAIIEMAAWFKEKQNDLKYSILFLALAGEEHGLLGASNFAKAMTVDSSKIRMMINIDMIGRLKDQDNGLAILGTGTCEEFKLYFDSLRTDNLKLSMKESGTGPSDHTIFYNRKIPVLHFFTGAHMDYHKPSDDIEKIDSEGVVKVVNLITDIVEHFDQYAGSLTFTKTKDSGEGKRRARYSVTLGVMPDYVAEVKGLKIDGVMEDRPGGRAGMLEGDIVIQMGDIVINDIYDYMNALGKFRKGDTTQVIVNRNNENIELKVIFE